MSNPTELPDLDSLEALARAADSDFADSAKFSTKLILQLIALARRAQPEGEAPQADDANLRAALVAVDDQLVAILNGGGDAILGKLKAARNDLVRIWLPLDTAPAATLSPLCGAQHAESGKEAVEAAAKAIYELLPPCQGVSAKDHPWQPGGNSIKQYEARDYARAALAAQSQGARDFPVGAILRNIRERVMNDQGVPVDLIDKALAALAAKAEAPAGQQVAAPGPKVVCSPNCFYGDCPPCVEADVAPSAPGTPEAPTEVEKALRELMSIVRIHSDMTDDNFAWAEMQYAEEVLRAAQLDGGQEGSGHASS